ncbi:MAG: YlxR family protein [Deltaproteobacteria bacterium]|nr:MAG: YlxR family protein [Deltaproteobacteria bacterium]
MGKGRGHIPTRTCISCGAKRSKRELMRLVANGGGHLIRDDAGKVQGRGAYVCKSESCRKQLSKNKRILRRFKTEKAIAISPDMWAAE